MGNEKSRQPLDTKLSGTGRWVMVSLAPAETLTYDPKVSFAVCVGVGEQLELGSNHVGQSANNDARVIREVLQDHYGFLEDQTSLLTTDCPDISTCAAIKEALRRRARQVSEDGILLFQFSGHCDKKRSGQVYLVPADFTPNVQDSALSIADIASCVEGTKVKHFLIIADCCYAGQIAESLLQESTGKVTTHIVAACSGMQRALHYKKIGHGFFTYFMSKYLRERQRKEETPKFPIYPLIEYCKPLCQAVAVIISPAKGCDVLMEPEATSFSNNSLEEEDNFGGPRTIRNLWQFDHITKYLSCSRPAHCMTRIPDSVDLGWLDIQARGALLTLYKERLLFAPEMYNTMMVFLSQAIAALSHQELKKIDVSGTPESLLNVDLCVLACLSCADVLASIDKRLIPQLQHVMTWVEFYIIKVKDLLGLDIKSEELSDLMTLLLKVNSDTQKFQPSEGDSADGEKEGTPEEEEQEEQEEEKTEDEKVQMLYEKLESLSALMDLPHIPQLEEIGTE
ncbi:uncharacterized protein LOC106178350 [Lingula anatina]|uniref:Uncharacterized protein LOC106178350 n=1 Tax=Lingula anatina TaxID=7574 RepID=A0A1S3K2T0_LINAN|nr:uncharacterized protein LOC106178350 [Lingula anatina]|eukprot:XP_013416943.1 uncharacterized protein LOC106178350 [Lingula anatina]